MARTVISRVVDTEIDGTRFLAIARFLRTDAGAEERAKGGYWVKAEDRQALTQALTVAREFAQALERELAQAPAQKAPAKAAAPKSAPKPPTPPVAPKAAPKPAPAQRTMCDAAYHADANANGAKSCPLCGKNTSALKAPAIKPASKPAPAPKVSVPVPASGESLSAADWANLIG